jgi:hypothetical protein
LIDLKGHQVAEVEDALRLIKEIFLAAQDGCPELGFLEDGGVALDLPRSSSEA